MSAKEMICKNCKYHYIEELAFDYPQSCCRYRSTTTEQWCKCNDFEYGDRYVEQLQKENQELKEKIETYEDPKDLTLMFMYCDEKAKDKIKELKKQQKNKRTTNLIKADLVEKVDE